MTSFRERLRRYIAATPPGTALTARRVARIFDVDRHRAATTLALFASQGELHREAFGLYRTPLSVRPSAEDRSLGTLGVPPDTVG